MSSTRKQSLRSRDWSWAATSCWARQCVLRLRIHQLLPRDLLGDGDVMDGHRGARVLSGPSVWPLGGWRCRHGSSLDAPRAPDGSCRTCPAAPDGARQAVGRAGVRSGPSGCRCWVAFWQVSRIVPMVELPPPSPRRSPLWGEASQRYRYLTWCSSWRWASRWSLGAEGSERCGGPRWRSPSLLRRSALPSPSTLPGQASRSWTPLRGQGRVDCVLGAATAAGNTHRRVHGVRSALRGAAGPAVVRHSSAPVR